MTTGTDGGSPRPDAPDSPDAPDAPDAPSSDRLRLLWWNTFLLRPPRLLPRWVDVGLDPGVAERAGRIGDALAGDYDAVALTEVFHRDDRAVVAERLGPSIRSVPGPRRGDRRGRFVGSGLVAHTPHSVHRVLSHTFARSGSRLLDSDAHATKGFTMVELGGRAEGVEIVVTHLHAGGWGIGRRSPAAGARVRASQVRELVEVVGRAHRPGNVLLIGGDFNVEPDKPAAGEPDLDREMAELGLVDLWPAHGSGPGWTAPGHRLHHLSHPDPDDERFAHDGVDHLDHHHELKRIDLLFGPDATAEPRRSTGAHLTDVVLRRRGFPAPDLATSSLTTLSDHLALHLDARLER